MQTEENRRSEAAARDHETANGTRAARPAGIRALIQASWPGPPAEIGAHSRSKLGYRLHWIGADRKRPQVESPGGARGPPARIFALGRDELDLNRDGAVPECRNADIEAIADLEAFHEILAKIEMHPEIGQIDQGNERDARRHV